MSDVVVRRRRLPWWGKLAMVAFSCAFTWGVLEVALRVTGVQAPTATALGTMFQPNSDTGWLGRPNVDTQFVGAEFATRVRHSADGWRWCGVDAPLAEDDAYGGRSVWILGDSFTWGWGVSDEETFVARLNEMGPAGVRYRNLGVPGYSSVQEYLLLKRLVEQGRRPDVVIVRFCGNDLMDNIWMNDNDPPRPGLAEVDGQFVIQGLPVRPSPLWTVSSALRRHSAAAGFVSYHVHRLRQALRAKSRPMGVAKSGRPDGQTGGQDATGAQAATASQATTDRTDSRVTPFAGMDAEYPESAPEPELRASQQVSFLRDAYGRMKELCDRHQIELAVASEFRVHPALRFVCRELDIRLIDVSARHARFRASSDAARPLYFPQDGHCTPLGHQLIAEAIHEQLHGARGGVPPRLAERPATSREGAGENVRR